MKLLYLAIMFFVGCLLPLQTGINTMLRITWSKSPVLSSFVSFTFGAILLGVILIITRTPIPALNAANFVWWHWIGGACGVALLVSTLYFGPIIGITDVFVMVIVGQLIAAMILDHFGLLGFTLKPVTLPRIAGVGFLIVGILLIQKN